MICYFHITKASTKENINPNVENHFLSVSQMKPATLGRIVKS